VDINTGKLDWGNCLVCGVKIQVMAFRGTGACGENHRKQLAGEHDEPKAVAP
jgi:hypothetical protein